MCVCVCVCVCVYTLNRKTRSWLKLSTTFSTTAFLGGLFLTTDVN